MIRGSAALVATLVWIGCVHNDEPSGAAEIYVASALHPIVMGTPPTSPPSELEARECETECERIQFRDDAGHLHRFDVTTAPCAHLVPEDIESAVITETVLYSTGRASWTVRLTLTPHLAESLDPLRTEGTRAVIRKDDVVVATGMLDGSDDRVLWLGMFRSPESAAAAVGPDFHFTVDRLDPGEEEMWRAEFARFVEASRDFDACSRAGEGLEPGSRRYLMDVLRNYPEIDSKVNCEK